jgi:hypothetical protein
VKVELKMKVESPWLYAATPDAVKELMDGGGEFNPPVRLLSDLSEEQAKAVFPGAPYSISQIVSHMLWNLQGVLAELDEDSVPRPGHLEDTFKAVEPGGWEPLLTEFLAAVERCKRTAVEKAGETSPSRSDTNTDYDLAEAALHNAYHLGQIVLLRRMCGWWPPEGGDLNDF